MNTSDTDLLAIQAKVEQTLETSTPIEDVFMTIDLIKFMQSTLADYRTQLSDYAVVRLREAGATKPGKAIRIGEVLRWAGCTKETKSIDLRATAEGMMGAVGGDWQRFTDCLSTNAFKPGECRKVLAETNNDALFDKLFSTTQKWKLDDKGEEVPTLQEMNLMFLK